MESPLNQKTKKRSRRYYEEAESCNEMELDEVSVQLFTLSNLTIDELIAAQSIAKSQLQNTCFVTVDLDPSELKKAPFVGTKISSNLESNPFIEMEDDAQSDSTFIPSTPHNYSLSLHEDSSCYAPVLHAAAALFLKQSDASPTMLNNDGELSDRSLKIKQWIIKNNVELELEANDTKDLARIITFIIMKANPLLPASLKPACQGVLAVNQATTRSSRISGTSIKIPNNAVKRILRFLKLTRNIVILMSPLCRQLLEFVVEFCCSLCMKASITARNSWARQLAMLFARLIDPSPSSQHWATLFFELLLHSHGLYSQSKSTNELRIIWCMDAKFERELREKVRSSRTPSRRRTVMTTPRKSVQRQSLLGNIKRGSTLGKNLFKSKHVKNPVSKT